MPSSGLEELANVVASSGLASGLANRVPTPQQMDYATPMPRPASKAPLMIGLGGIVAVLLGVIGYLLFTKSTPPPAAPVVNPGQGPVATPIVVELTSPPAPMRPAAVPTATPTPAATILPDTGRRGDPHSENRRTGPAA